MGASAELSDSQLIARFLEGQSLAFDEIVRRYEPTLSGFLRRMVRDEALADDLFQETFLRVMRTLPDYRETGRFRSWLFGIARNLAIDALRRARLEQGLFLRHPRGEGGQTASVRVEIGTEDPALAPDMQAERAEWSERLEAAIAQLPPEQREVIALRFGAGFTFRQIAEITGCSINTSLGRMRYATTALRKRFGVSAATEGNHETS